MKFREHRTRLPVPLRHRFGHLAAQARASASAVLLVPVVTGDGRPGEGRRQPVPRRRGRRRDRSGAARRSAPRVATNRRRAWWSPSLPVASVLAVGLGKPRNEWPCRRDPASIRRGVAARALSGVESDRDRHSRSSTSQGAVEGLILGAYRFSDFRSAKTAPKEPGLDQDHGAGDGEDREGRRRPRAPTSQRPSRRRATWSTPRRAICIPDEFAKRARALGESVGLKVEILDEKALEKGGYGGIVGVGKGSSRPPRLVRLTHEGGSRARSPRRSPWSARALPSTPAASPSSPPPTCIT